MISTDFDKYYHYHASVQSTDFEADFLINTFLEIRGHLPKSFREDFCGTFALSCELARAKQLQSLLPKLKIYGVDIDPEPVAYGKEHYLSELTDEQKQVIDIREGNVLTGELPKVQMAFSFLTLATLLSKSVMCSSNTSKTCTTL